MRNANRSLTMQRNDVHVRAVWKSRVRLILLGNSFEIHALNARPDEHDVRISKIDEPGCIVILTLRLAALAQGCASRRH